MPVQVASFEWDGPRFSGKLPRNLPGTWTGQPWYFMGFGEELS